MDFILGHKIIILDDVSSFFWYAISLGKPVLLSKNINRYKVYDSIKKVFVDKTMKASESIEKLGITSIVPHQILNQNGELQVIADELLGTKYVSVARENLKSHVINL